jgi:hypothetical protein
MDMKMRSVGSIVILFAAATGAAPPLHAQSLAEAEAAALPVAGFEDYVEPIGRMEDGIRENRIALQEARLSFLESHLH